MTSSFKEYRNANDDNSTCCSPLSCCKKSDGYSRLDGEVEENKAPFRDLAAFFICGLLNNFGYTVMLSAASDMLRDANFPVDSPAVVLLADILPCVIVQGIAPYFMGYIPYGIRVTFIVATAIASFLLPAFFHSIVLKMLGVVLASISSGFGEINFLALTASYHKNTVSAFSSGTGAAGVLGSLSYLLLTYIFPNSTKLRLIVSSPLPLAMAFSYFVLMTKPQPKSEDILETEDKTKFRKQIPLSRKLQLTIQLLPYMIPLFLVYFGEYLINQSVVAVFSYPEKFVHGLEYKYCNTIYQVGVLISRSSVNFFPIKRLWMPALFQTINLAFLSCVAVWNFIPSIWIIFVIVLWEGLLGGSIYVNTFWRISEDFKDEEKEYCLGGTSISYAVSITLSGVVGIAYYPALKDWRAKHNMRP